MIYIISKSDQVSQPRIVIYHCSWSGQTELPLHGGRTPFVRHLHCLNPLFYLLVCSTPVPPSQLKLICLNHKYLLYSRGKSYNSLRNWIIIYLSWKWISWYTVHEYPSSVPHGFPVINSHVKMEGVVSFLWVPLHFTGKNKPHSS